MSKYENPDWDLEFAANDARLIHRTLVPKLRVTKAYDDVVEVLLTSEKKVKNGRASVAQNATKTSFHNVLKLLAGEKLNVTQTSEIPNAGRIQRATPEDIVIVFYSSHGYRDADRFYLFPYNTGPGPGRDPEAVVPNAISSDDLYQWLREIDAGEIVLVIDAVTRHR